MTKLMMPSESSDPDGPTMTVSGDFARRRAAGS